jgi:hypothetical protein
VTSSDMSVSEEAEIRLAPGRVVVGTRDAVSDHVVVLARSWYSLASMLLLARNSKMMHPKKFEIPCSLNEPT